MPMYAFRCPSCGREYEELVPRAGETAPCPQCGETKVELKLSAPATHSGKTGSADCGSGPGSGFR